MSLCEVCYSESLEGDRYCSQCASVLGVTSAQEEPAIIPLVTPLPLPPVAPAANRATGNSVFSKLWAWWAATEFTNKIIISAVAIIVIFFALALAILPSSSNSNFPKSDEAVTKHKDSTLPPIPPRNRTPAERLARAKTYLADPQLQYDLDQAKSELQLIPPGVDQYQEARMLLAKIAAGKFKLLSEFELKHRNAVVMLRQVNPDVTYGKLKKNANSFIGQAWAFTGKVLEIHELGATTTARVGVGSYGLDAVYIECSCMTDMVEDNAVFVVGTVQGNYIYETVAGWTLTIPQIKAVAIVTPGEGAKLRAAAQRR
jgi:hypothetical protein